MDDLNTRKAVRTHQNRQSFLRGRCDVNRWVGLTTDLGVNITRRRKRRINAQL